jgi:capsular exopolysaccharide synthesis family protein
VTAREYLSALRRRWLIIAAAVAVALAAAWVTTNSIAVPKKLPRASSYSATNLMSGGGIGVLAPLGGGLGNLSALPTFVAIGDVPDRVAKALDYNKSPQALVGLIQAVADPTTGFLKITATAPDPKWAADVANEFATQLIGWTQDQQRKRGAKVTVLLEEQLSELRADIEELDRTIPVSSGFDVQVLTAQREAKISRYQALFEQYEAIIVPVLADIPRLSRPLRREKAFTPRSSGADAFVLLATTLIRRLESGHVHKKGDEPSSESGELATAILVTSPGPGDGKTTVTANLAAGFGEMGSRVLIMSCDFRHPQIHQLLGVPNIHGLSDALLSSNGKPILDRCILEGRVGELDLEVIPSGPPPNHPGEVLSSEVMRRALLEARRRADVVILDSPAILAASDASLLFPEVDAVLVVARAGHTTERDAHRTQQLLSRLMVAEAGIAMNGVGEDATSRRYLETSETPRTKRRGFPRLASHQGRH